MEQERLQLLKRESKEAEEFVLKLDQEQDNRPLTAAEIQDRKEAKKNRILEMAAVRKIQIRQRSRYKNNLMKQSRLPCAAALLDIYWIQSPGYIY
jgi:hypothetical protein